MGAGQLLEQQADERTAGPADLVQEDGRGHRERRFGGPVLQRMGDPVESLTQVVAEVAVAGELVERRSPEEVEEALAEFEGTLTGTVQAAGADDEAGLRMLDLLARYAGRVIWNQWPTGVTVSDAQQHGGPWPASTAPTTTSVGTAAIRRFRRPVAFQNVPGTALPPELRDRAPRI